MKTKHITYLLVLLLVSACYTVEKPEKPDNLLSEDKMVDVLIEMSLMYSAKSINKWELEKNAIIPDAFIYEKQGIDSLQFAQSNYYYAFNIEKYNEIYGRVRDSLKQLKEKYKVIQEEEQRVKDSIRKIEKAKLKTEKLPVKKRTFKKKQVTKS